MKSRIFNHPQKIVLIISLVLATVFILGSCSKNEKLNVKSISGFNATDIEGNTVTSDYLKENNITAVNVMTTTSAPCLDDLKSFIELSKDFKGKLGFLCLNIDMDMHGEPEEESLKTIKKIYDENKNESTIKIIYPDEILMDNVLMNLEMIPCTFFVDKNGNVIGRNYFGNNSKKEWEKIIKREIKSNS